MKYKFINAINNLGMFSSFIVCCASCLTPQAFPSLFYVKKKRVVCCCLSFTRPTEIDVRAFCLVHIVLSVCLNRHHLRQRRLRFSHLLQTNPSNHYVWHAYTTTRLCPMNNSKIYYNLNYIFYSKILFEYFIAIVSSPQPQNSYHIYWSHSVIYFYRSFNARYERDGGRTRRNWNWYMLKIGIICVFDAGRGASSGISTTCNLQFHLQHPQPHHNICIVYYSRI